jgi:ParB-like chromosome segregation protein Spo0J
MPRKAKPKTEPETNPVEAAPESPTTTKKQAIKAALKANPKKSNIEIAEILLAEGWDAKPTYISVVKSNMNKGKRKKKAAAVAATPAADSAPALPKDAVSLALLQKAKKLVKDLGGVKAAKQAIDALAQLLD